MVGISGQPDEDVGKKVWKINISARRLLIETNILVWQIPDDLLYSSNSLPSRQAFSIYSIIMI